MTNYYAQAIQVLANSQADFKALIHEIAKVNPKAVASAAERLAPKAETPWQVKALQFMRDDSKIEAIKYCRTMTGMGLKEAKEACEALYG